MEKDIGKIKKNEFTDIVVRIDDFGGKVGLTIREFSHSDRYTGFTKSGTKIPAENFKEFKDMINSIDEKEIEDAVQSAAESAAINTKSIESSDDEKKVDEEQKKLSDEENEVEEKNKGDSESEKETENDSEDKTEEGEEKKSEEKEK